MPKCHWFAHEVLWCRYHRVPITGTLPQAYCLIQRARLWPFQAYKGRPHRCTSIPSPPPFLCGWANYSHMHAVMSFYWCHMEKRSKCFVAYAETRSTLILSKDRFATVMKTTDKPSAVKNHQASTYEFCYLCSFQNPSFHIDHQRSSIFYESKGYDLHIWSRKPTAVQSRRKPREITLSLYLLCASMVQPRCAIEIIYIPGVVSKGSYDHPWK